MDAIKILKDVVSAAQKSNDIEMIQKVISAQEEVINMQDKITKLQNENQKLKEKEKLSKDIERYQGTTLITLKSDDPKIPYCSTCYGNEGKLIQMKIKGELCQCFNCNSYFYFSESPKSENIRSMFR